MRLITVVVHPEISRKVTVKEKYNEGEGDNIIIACYLS